LIAAREPRPTRDHRAVSGHGEGPVDGHPEQAGVDGRPHSRAEGFQRPLELVDPLSGRRRGPDDRCPFQEGSPDQRTDVVLDHVDPARLDQVTLGHDHHAARKAQQPQDLQVLARLGHDRVVRRDDQHGEVEAGRAGQHVADEPLVAGDVDHRQPILAHFQRREAQVDRDPPLLLRRQAIGVHPGEGPHQGGLAVIDVAGGPDHEVAYRFVHGPPSIRKPTVTTRSRSAPV
jgi:hypothetical protein